ncbi:P2 family phage major capsid protein [Enterococcus faecium]|nr:hypothetical protein [Enterococcus faecium]EGP4707108.1 P2 family phage major capsid protein [Enterococcus faecium]EGP4709906.1 P2 family phage major capsid protein [Enterococcus faecium]OTO06798.1 hypothetical protein A5801_000837 [Enterococcus faecium]
MKARNFLSRINYIGVSEDSGEKTLKKLPQECACCMWFNVFVRW